MAVGNHRHLHKLPEVGPDKYWLDELTQYPIPETHWVGGTGNYGSSFWVIYNMKGEVISLPSDNPQYGEIFEAIGIDEKSLEICRWLAMSKLNGVIDAICDKVVSEDAEKDHSHFNIINGLEGSLTYTMNMRQFRTFIRTGVIAAGDGSLDFFDKMFKPSDGSLRYIDLNIDPDSPLAHRIQEEYDEWEGGACYVERA